MRTAKFYTRETSPRDAQVLLLKARSPRYYMTGAAVPSDHLPTVIINTLIGYGPS